jgi:hypothetical protein
VADGLLSVACSSENSLKVPFVAAALAAAPAGAAAAVEGVGVVGSVEGAVAVAGGDAGEAAGAVDVSPKPTGSTPTLLVTVVGCAAAGCAALVGGAGGRRSRTSLITGTRTAWRAA